MATRRSVEPRGKIQKRWWYLDLAAVALKVALKPALKVTPHIERDGWVDKRWIGVEGKFGKM